MLESFHHIGKLFPQGELPVNTQTLGTTDETRLGLLPSLQKTSSTQGENLETIKKILLTEALKVKEILNWVLSVKLPTARYSEPGLMLAAANLDLESDLKQTNLIYDAPLEVQVAYWDFALSLVNGIFALTQQPEHALSGSSVVLMGHHCRHKQIPERIEQIDHPLAKRAGIPSARSITPHHDHLLVIPPTLPGEPYQGTEFGLPQERALMTDEADDLNPYLLTNFIAFVRDGFKHKLTVRETMPHGYSFLAPNHSKKLAKILQEHFIAYKAAVAASEYIEVVELGLNIPGLLQAYIDNPQKHGRVIQPAFTFYLVPHSDSQVEIIISPMLLGIGGPERAGIKLQRSPEQARRFSDEEYGQILADIKAIPLRANASLTK